jgi:hypothetical protein
MLPFLCGGAKRDRTADLLHAMQPLSQLSYSPVFGCNSLIMLEFYLDLINDELRILVTGAATVNIC